MWCCFLHGPSVLCRQDKNNAEKRNSYRKVKGGYIFKVPTRLKPRLKRTKINMTYIEITYMTSFEMKGSNIYGLNKVHKIKTIMEAIKAHKTSCIEIKSSDVLKFHSIVPFPPIRD